MLDTVQLDDSILFQHAGVRLFLTELGGGMNPSYLGRLRGVLETAGLEKFLVEYTLHAVECHERLLEATKLARHFTQKGPGNKDVALLLDLLNQTLEAVERRLTA